MMNPSGTKFSGDKIVPQSEHRSWQLYNNEKNGLLQFQMESCQPIKRMKDKKNKHFCEGLQNDPRIEICPA
jgi:hypothetical protein